MGSEAIIAVASTLFGGALVAVVTSLMTRRKVQAETEMLRAQAERERAEATRILFDLKIHETDRGASPDNGLPDHPAGWFLAGSHPNDFTIGVDRDVRLTGTGSGCIRSLRQSHGFGTLMQMCDPALYRGKRIRMSGVVRARDVRNGGSVQLWLRADGASDRILAFDNMEDRPITTDQNWTKHSIVLDIPEETVNLAFGILVGRHGTAWVDSFAFDEVGEDVETTDRTTSAKSPRGDFDSRIATRPTPWVQTSCL